MAIYFVTGKPEKAREVAAIMGAAVEHLDLNLSEIQTTDMRELVECKASAAFANSDGRPVLVEDVAFYLEALGGFPGPFVKFWNEKGGPGYERAVRIAEALGEFGATALCSVGYTDGKNFFYAEGRVEGWLVRPRGVSGFGFDPYFEPIGSSLTFAEMGETAKNTCSHRFRGFTAMRTMLEDYGAI
jgi:non-canonical purine NTP pyrophosphatase (RdgB/HAM1 family)